jgi:amidase
MNLAEYGSYDAVGLAELVRTKQVSPAELAKTALAAIDKLNPKLNAIAMLYREQGDALDEKSLPEGPFRGVPFMVKPIGITEKGKPVGDLGSNMFAPGELPKAAYDCYVVQKFREVGLNIMGRTHLPELAYTITVESPHQGVTHNPWSPEILAGGSSTGSAVLVAAGVLPMAHASDGAGSTRFPAAVNGVIGMKPSRGRISIGPDVSDISALKISHFAVTRTVRDTAALLDAVAGGLPGESVMYRTPETSFASEIKQPPGKLRVALSNMMWHTKDLHPEVKEQLNKVGKKLEELGHIVTEDKPDIDFDAYPR